MQRGERCRSDVECLAMNKIIGPLGGSLRAFVAISGAAAVALAIDLAAAPQRLEIKTLSTDAQHVTGGDVLVEIAVPADADARSLKIMANGTDVTTAFRGANGPRTRIGL